MPVHDYQCACGKRKEHFLKIEDLGSTVWCQCGQAMTRLVSAPYVRGDYPPYECPITGNIIEGRRAHEENLKRHGCRLWEEGETEAYQRHLRQENEKLDKAIEETADQLISALPTEKRDRLAAEMEGGLTAKIERSTPKLT